MQVNKTSMQEQTSKARPLRKNSKYLLFFSLSLKSLNNLQHTISLLKQVLHISDKYLLKISVHLV